MDSIRVQGVGRMALGQIVPLPGIEPLAWVALDPRALDDQAAGLGAFTVDAVDPLDHGWLIESVRFHPARPWRWEHGVILAEGDAQADLTLRLRRVEPLTLPAVRLLDAGRPLSALRVLPAEPDWRGLRHRARARALLGQWPRAIADLTRSLQLFPSARTRLIRAEALRVAGDLETALADLDTVLRREPSHVAALVIRTRVLVGLGRLGEALQVADTLVDSTDPIEVAHLLQRALVYELRDELDAALRDTEHALRLSTEPDEREAIGRLLREREARHRQAHRPAPVPAVRPDEGLGGRVLKVTEDGDRLTAWIALTPREAGQGCDVQIGSVRVRLPPGARPGAELRVREAGPERRDLRVIVEQVG